MKVKYREDPAAWSKSTLLTVLGLALFSSVLCWRHMIPRAGWLLTLGLLALLAILSLVRPNWFRGYYRFSTWAGFWSSQCVARVFLALIFVVMITPAGLVMRLSGKDPLRLRRLPNTTSYWKESKQGSSLDRLF